MRDLAKVLAFLICLVVIIVGFTSAGNARNNVEEAIYIAIGCLGLIGLAIVITQLSVSAAPKQDEGPKPAARSATKTKVKAALATAESKGTAAEDAFAVEAALARAEAEAADEAAKARTDDD